MPRGYQVIFKQSGEIVESEFFSDREAAEKRYDYLRDKHDNNHYATIQITEVN